MPNGGSDCCGTCWFNRRNKGEAGFLEHDESEPSYFEIRELAIDDPFYTYCANHPHRVPWKLQTPIGPVFMGDSDGYREIWKQAADTENTRLSLLALLGRLPESQQNEYPIGPGLGDVVISELVRLDERRAIPDLERIAKMKVGRPDRFGNTNGPLIELARSALDRLNEA